MSSNNILYTLCVLVALLYLKHILFVMYYTFSALDAIMPAKKVGERPRNLTYEFKGKVC